MGLIAYNLLMAIQVGAVLFLQRYSRHPAPLRSTVGFVMAALGLGSLLGLGLGLYPHHGHDATFAMMNLWAYGLFGFTPVLLLGQAWLLVRRGYRRRAGLCVLIAVVLVGIAVDAFVIEPYDLQVRKVQIRSAKLDRPYRIVVMADLQTDQAGAYERRAFETAIAAQPDLVLMPGDYVHADNPEHFRQVQIELSALMKRVGFAAPLGIHAVEGNVDEYRDWTAVFQGLDVATYPTTATAAIGGLSLTALSLDDSFQTKLRVGPRPGFHIVMGHAPDFALGEIEADLLVAGHTHGGQVQLPGIGPLITFSQVPRAWADGVTRLLEDRHLIVSRGVGMERKFAPRLRFRCRPELVIIDLEPEP